MKPIRICFVLSIIACFTIAALNAIHLKRGIIKVQTELKDKAVLLERTERDLLKSQRTLASATSALKQTEAILAKTTTSEQSALASLAQQTKRADELAQDLRNVSKQRDEALSELAAYRCIGAAEEMVVWAKRIKELQTTLTAVQQENKLLGRKVKRLEGVQGGKPETVALPADLKANVAVYDPKYQFVVLNAGEEQGVLPQGELLLNRGGKLIAKVRVSRIEKNRCVANPVSGWQFAEIHEGDVAIPADAEL